MSKGNGSGSSATQDAEAGLQQAAPTASLPSATSTPSFWHHAAHRLLGHRTTAGLPGRADVVVVGAGVAGAFAARELVRLGVSVVMVEAREACWGATGRNAGRCQPDVWNNGATPHIARFELATYAMLRDLVRRETIDCSWDEVGGAHVLLSETEAAAAQDKIGRLPEELRGRVRVERDRAGLRVRGAAVGAVVQREGARCWPYKLVEWVLERMLEEGGARFNLQTWTAVEGLQRVVDKGVGRKSVDGSGQDEASWLVQTRRGDIAARHVVLATNAYTSFLLPRMARLVVPVRGQVCALLPPPRAVLLPHDYTWLSHGADNYLIQRRAGQDGDPTTGSGGGAAVPPDSAPSDSAPPDSAPPESGGLVIVGGERLLVRGGQEHISADDVVEPTIGAALRTAVPRVLELQTTPQEPRDEVLRAAWEWTGIMGYSRDARPWVGRVPGGLLPARRRTGSEAEGDGEGDGPSQDGDGLWICAGFTSHGMPVAPRCAVGLARMVVGKPDGVDLPPEYMAREERLAVAAARVDLPRGAWDH